MLDIRPLRPLARAARTPRPGLPSLPADRGMDRPRLGVALDTLWSKRMGLVVAPPGSGKTTLLTSWAHRCGALVAWYCAETTDSSGPALLAGIRRALAGILPQRSRWDTVADAICGLSQLGGGPLVLVVDDLHLLAGTEAETTLACLLEHLPPNTRVLAASRQAPALSLSRLRLDDGLVELGSDDLRFRTWEAGSLFGEHYGCAMLPEEVARLTQKTEGWAAGLQLFHLATRDKSPSERARMLAGFSAHSRLVADYLAENVLAGLDADLVEFLVRTCPLEVLTGEICDELLDATNSAATLAEVERRQLFVSSDDGGQTYRYHSILRGYLDGRLVDRLGEPGARQWHYRAGRLLLAKSFPGAAVRALCRAEAWEEAAGVLARLNQGGGGPLVESRSSEVDPIRDRLADCDPWVALARARGHVGAGRLGPALAAYRACEPGLPRRAADTCRAEMVAVSAWASGQATPAPGWTNALRRGVERDPLQAPGSIGEAGNQAGAVSGLCALMAGNPGLASGLLDSAAESSISPILGLAVRVAALLASLLARRDPPTLEVGTRRALVLAGEAERLGSPWLARQAYALLALTGTPEIAAQVRAQCRHEADRWGEALAELVEGAGRLASGEAPAELLSLAAGRFRVLGAGVLESWALACAALAEARSGAPQARQAALAAEASARSAGVPGAQALAHLALGVEARHACSARIAAEHLRLARSLAQVCGLGILTARPAVANLADVTGLCDRSPEPAGRKAGLSGRDTEPAARESGPSGRVAVPGGQESGLTLGLFGGLVARQGGQVLDLGSLRPRALALLALLALRYPRPVHCEVLTEALWPDADPRSGAHGLQTAVSSLRRVLAGALRPAPKTLVRRGEAYVLVADAVDVADLASKLAEAGRARREKDLPTEVAALGRVLEVHRADLLPELGPTDWVVKERDQLRWSATEAAERLAEIELGAGHPAAALSAARAGLALDRYRESLWRLALRAARAADDHGLVSAVSAARAEALAELGIVG
jgi:DNA-binding SARP family transcriptional activator